MPHGTSGRGPALWYSHACHASNLRSLSDCCSGSVYRYVCIDNYVRIYIYI